MKRIFIQLFGTKYACYSVDCRQCSDKLALIECALNRDRNQVIEEAILEYGGQLTGGTSDVGEEDQQPAESAR